MSDAMRMGPSMVMMMKERFFTLERYSRRMMMKVFFMAGFYSVRLDRVL